MSRPGAIALLILAWSPAGAQQSRVALLKQADIVFVGTVLKVAAASLPGVPVSAQTLIVRVDGVLDKPAAVTLAAGDSVTVQARVSGSLPEGTRATFYTTGWIFGRSVAVREVGHERVPAQVLAAGLAARQDSLRVIRRQVSDTELRARIRAADIVVVGRVETIQAATMAVQPHRPVTEHDPNWKEAVIVVDSSLKGARAGQRLVVRFPSSLDVAWHAMPRFTAGQQGTFLLRQDRLSGSPRAMLTGQEVTAYAAVSRQDVLSTQDAARVRTLLRP